MNASLRFRSPTCLRCCDGMLVTGEEVVFFQFLREGPPRELVGAEPILHISGSGNGTAVLWGAIRRSSGNPTPRLDIERNQHQTRTRTRIVLTRQTCLQRRGPVKECRVWNPTPLPEYIKGETDWLLKLLTSILNIHNACNNIHNARNLQERVSDIQSLKGLKLGLKWRSSISSKNVNETNCKYLEALKNIWKALSGCFSE